MGGCRASPFRQIAPVSGFDLTGNPLVGLLRRFLDVLAVVAEVVPLDVTALVESHPRQPLTVGNGRQSNQPNDAAANRVLGVGGLS